MFINISYKIIRQQKLDSYEYDIINIKYLYGMNICMVQLLGKCENVFIRLLCLDGLFFGVEFEIKLINGFGS